MRVHCHHYGLLLDCFVHQGVFVNVDGARDIDEVFSDVADILKNI